MDPKFSPERYLEDVKKSRRDLEKRINVLAPILAVGLIGGVGFAILDKVFDWGLFWKRSEPPRP